MIGKITKNGLLEIKRGFEFKEQNCPTDFNGDNCGDWCPLFGEPEEIPHQTKSQKYFDRIKICVNDRWLLFTELTDER